MPAKPAAQALWLNLLSTETPRTWVLQASNSLFSAFRPGISVLQVGVKSSG